MRGRSAMRLPVLLTITLLATASLAGCFGAKDAAENLEDNNIDLPEVVELRPLTGLAVTAAEEWVKPNTAVQFEATPPVDAVGAVTYAWHYGAAEATAPIQFNFPLAAGESAEQALDTAGIYHVASEIAPDAHAVLTVTDDGETGVQHVALVDTDDGAVAFAPAQLELGAGSTVVFHNNATGEQTVALVMYDAPLTPVDGATGPSAEFAFPEDGKQRVVVVATDEDNGTAQAVTKVLVDSAKPEPVYEETFEGELQFAGVDPTVNEQAPVWEPAEHPFKLDYDGTLTATFEATPTHDGPSDVVVKLVDKDGNVLAETAPGASGEIPATDLTKGAYKIVVEGVQGGPVSYVVNLEAQLDLVPPSEDAHGGHGGHGDHGGH